MSDNEMSERDESEEDGLMEELNQRQAEYYRSLIEPELKILNDLSIQVENQQEIIETQQNYINKLENDLTNQQNQINDIVTYLSSTVPYLESMNKDLQVYVDEKLKPKNEPQAKLSDLDLLKRALETFVDEDPNGRMLANKFRFIVQLSTKDQINHAQVGKLMRQLNLRSKQVNGRYYYFGLKFKDFVDKIPEPEGVNLISGITHYFVTHPELYVSNIDFNPVVSQVQNPRLEPRVTIPEKLNNSPDYGQYLASPAPVFKNST